MQEKRSFLVVGIGASAGGLEAFRGVLKALPAKTGVAFVLVQHLDPQHESELVALLSRVTRLAVHEASADVQVQPDHVYVIPPNATLTISGGALQLARRQEGLSHPIDAFFESLAADLHERAVGVVLSGTASDGTRGLEAIKGEGGFTFAQDDTAKYDSMPRSAVAAGCTDFILPPAAIAQKLVDLARHPQLHAERSNRPDGRNLADDEPPALDERNGHRQILEDLRKRTEVDFSFYKPNTVRRRIHRRMVVNGCDSLAGYAHFLHGRTDEVDALYHDLLISVTGFFRDPEAFEALEQKVIRELVRRRTDDPIRVWVPGCSTGDEAYSIAMLLAEAGDAAGRAPQINIFATDVSERLLQQARNGLYPRGIVGDVSPERLRRFFTQEEDHYRVTKSLRENIVFARHNLVSDPPLSHMDLVSCRNLLIYLEPGVHKRLLPATHYALNPHGFLFLGASESVGEFTDLYETLDNKHKIFTAKVAPTPSFQAPHRTGPDQHGPGGRTVPPSGSEGGDQPTQSMPNGGLTAEREADRVVIRQFAPPGILINDELQVLQFRGATDAYLQTPAGKASFDVLRMVRSGLRSPLRGAIGEARATQATVRRDEVRVKSGGGDRMVNLQVIPLKNLSERVYLVLFEDPGTALQSPHSSRPSAVVPGAPDADQEEAHGRIAELEDELVEVQDHLQFTRQQYETTNEELQASNEEVRSANEELQSINEELQTSKEELESSNEELSTVNEELSSRNDQLSRLTDDLVNFQNATRLALVLLDRDLSIRRFTPQAEKHFKLLAGDVGRPIGHLRHRLSAPSDAREDAVLDLEALADQAISKMSEQTCEVRDSNGRWCTLRALPYITKDRAVDGAVLILSDIDELKRNEQAAIAARDFATSIISTVREPLVVLDGDLRVQTASRSFYRTFNTTPTQTEGFLFFELANGQWDTSEVRHLLEENLSSNASFDDFEVEHDFEAIGRRNMLLSARRLQQSSDHPEMILLAIEDVTERRAAAHRTQVSEMRYRRLFESAQDAILILDAGTRTVVDANPFAHDLLGRSHEQTVGRGLREIGLFGEAHDEEAMVSNALEGGYVRYGEMRLQSGDGRTIDVEIVANMYEVDGERVIQFNIRDIAARKEAERAQRASEEVFRYMVDAMSDHAVVLLDREGRVASWNEGAKQVFGYSEQEVVGRPFGDFTPVENAGHLGQELQQARVEGRAEHNGWLLRKDGSQFWAAGVTSPLQNASPRTGGSLGFVKVVRDMTKQKEAEDALKESDRLKTEFLGVLGHELRNPLAPIRNALDLMGKVQHDADRVDGLRKMMARQVTHIIRLIDDLMDASRIGRGKLELKTETVQLGEAVDAAVEAMRPGIEENDQRLSVERAQESMVMQADSARLIQAFSNLLSNASKYSPRGALLQLTARRQGDEAVVRVRDEGIGIEPERLSAVFDMFTQEDPSAVYGRGGLGLGLTLSRTLVEMHGGRIEAHSEGLNGGSEFAVHLPLAAQQNIEVEASADERQPPPSGFRLTVVEDSQIVADLFAEMLREMDHEVVAVSDGESALAQVEAEQPDIVLCDISMPGMSGYQFAKTVRAQPALNGVILVGVSGYGQQADRERALAAGFDHYLVKPADMEQLESLFATIAAQRKR